MAIDASIAMGVKPVQIADPMNQMANMYQLQSAQSTNQLNRMKMEEAQRELEATNALNRAYQGAYDPGTGKIDYNKLRTNISGSGYGSKLPAIEKIITEQKVAEITHQKGVAELQAKKQEFIQQAQRDTSRNPSDANITAYKEDLMANPMFSDAEKAQMAAGADRLLAMPLPERQAFMAAQGAKSADLKPTLTPQQLGGTTHVLSTPAFGGQSTVVPGSTQTITESANNKATNERMKEEGRLNRAVQTDSRVVASTTTDEAGNVTHYNRYGTQIGTAQPTGKPSATFEKTKAARAQQMRDINMAIPELEAITKDGGLIDQSTGSGAGRAYDVAAGFFGQAPEGAIAIGKLKPIADMALKMVPRFEGPQSDKDTQSYKEAAGQLADPTLPTIIRKNAGKEVLRIMKARKGQFASAEMAAEGVSPSGVDASNPLLK